MAFERRSEDEVPARDVLAAEAFGMPAGDPSLHDELPHDVLAAEEFELPGGDPALRPGPVQLPDDRLGVDEPHDVLAAEEFAVPAGHAAAPPGDPERGSGRGARLLVAAALSGAVALVARRRGRRGRR